MEKDEKTQVIDDFNSKIAGWKAQYGELCEMQLDEMEDIQELNGVRIICKMPGRANISKFVKDVNAGDALKAQNNFFFDCLLYPDASVIKQVIDKKPGVVIALGNLLQSQTGFNTNFTMKKL